MLARWLAKLQEYDFEIVHRAGKLHGNADGLSRCHKCKNPECAGNFAVPLMTDSSEDEVDYGGLITRAKSRRVHLRHRR